MRWYQFMNKYYRFYVLVILILSSCLLIAATNKIKPDSDKFDFQKTSKLIHEMDSRPDFPVSILLTRDYVYSITALGETIDTANKSKIIEFIKVTQQSDGGFSADKAIKETASLYTDYAIETLAYLNAVGSIDIEKAKLYVLSLSRPDGGFAFDKQTKDSSLTTTYYAVHCLSLMNALSAVDKAKTADYVKGFEKKNGGFGYIKETGAPTAKNTYEAVFVLKTLGMLDGATKKSAAKFLTSSPYVTGKNKKGKEEYPTLEEEAYTLDALKTLGAGSSINKQTVISFVKEFYVPQNGGFASMPGYGAAPHPTYYGLRCLAETGVQLKPR
jgi:prenyltransferase beta subunit